MRVTAPLAGQRLRVTGLFFGRQGAGAFNAAGEAGLLGAAARLGFQARVEYRLVADPATRARIVAELAEDAPDLLLVHGGQGDAPVAAVAPGFPAQRFAVTQGALRAPNVATYEVLQEHSAFLAGVFAARTTRTGTVAHLSGERVRPGLAGRAAFAAGVAWVGGAKLLTGFCGDQHDPALARGWVGAMFGAGADLLFTMLDGGRPGAIAAAREAGAGLIGNVTDWTLQGTPFVASAIADNGLAMARALDDLAAGVAPWGGRHWAVGLDNPAAVRLALPAGAADPTEDAAALLRAGRVALPQDWAGAEFVL